MSEYPTREEVLESVRAKLGGYGAGRRLARISRVTKIAGAKWLREGIPRERVGLVSAITGIPSYVIRPDEFVPPVPGAECQSDFHRRSVGHEAA